MLFPIMAMAQQPKQIEALLNLSGVTITQEIVNKNLREYEYIHEDSVHSFVSNNTLYSYNEKDSSASYYNLYTKKVYRELKKWMKSNYTVCTPIVDTGDTFDSYKGDGREWFLLDKTEDGDRFIILICIYP